MTVSSAPPDAGFAFLPEGSETARLIAAFDWSGTALGPVAGWPAELRGVIGMALRAQVPMALVLGPSGVMIYNDAYAVIAGGRHPDILGAEVAEAWPEAADFNGAMLASVLAGETLSFRDQEFTLVRGGLAETAWMNLDYSPIAGPGGTPIGAMAFVVETSDKVRFERAVAGERERLRRMFEQAPSFMALLSGPDHVFDFANAAYLRLVGRDVIGLPLREALPDLAGQGFDELLDRVFETGEPFVGSEITAVLDRGRGEAPEERMLDFVYQPIRDEREDVVGIFVEGVDNTERFRAERARRRSEAELETLADALPIHAWAAGSDGRLSWVNRGCYLYAGAAPGTLTDVGWRTLVHPDDIAMADSRWAKALSDGEPYDVEMRLRRADGAYRWHIARAVPILDETGAPRRWIGTNTDIDDRRRAEEALRDNERRLRLSQEAAGIASLEVDIARGEVLGNDKLWELWGLPVASEGVDIRVFEELVIPEDRGIRSNAATREAGSSIPNVEYRIRRADTGELRWIARHVEFLHDADGRPAKMFGVMRDITAEKEALNRQRILTHELAHRIKNILATVSAIASQTLRDTDLDSARQALVRRLQALGRAHDILTATDWTAAPIGAVTEAAVRPFDSDRLSVAGPDVILGPRRALSLALALNELGTNALKYGALSGDAGQVEIRWWRREEADGAATFLWRWRERGGPEVVLPTRRGFGRFLLERVLAADFSGTVRIEFGADGVDCLLEAPWPTLAAGVE